LPVSFFLERCSMSHSSRRLGERHTPRKRFGQNFLADRNILRKIVRAAEVGPSDQVLEIGPGLGHLTHALAETGAQIISVELDRDLLSGLCTEFAGTPNVRLLEGDILKRPPDEWLALANAAPPYLVVANIPYYITSAILRYLLEAAAPPTRIILMVQREVAQALIAHPPHANLLGTSVQYYGTPRIIDTVPAGAFYPRPGVDSAIVRIDLDHRPRGENAGEFFRVVRAGFGARRKQLHNALARGLGLSTAQAQLLLHRANIDPARRAETLTIQEWIVLTRAVSALDTRQ
jgi:16S rRNA (adenine1518-N6/adenine1519-N6)-dimethyltransferase